MRHHRFLSKVLILILILGTVLSGGSSPGKSYAENFSGLDLLQTLENIQVMDQSVWEDGTTMQKSMFTAYAAIESSEMGFVYSEKNQNPLPTKDGSAVVTVSGTASEGAMSSLSEALKADTLYCLRAYAKDSSGTYVYSPVKEFATAISVLQGKQVGCEGVVSGGKYLRTYSQEGIAGALSISFNEGYYGVIDGRRYDYIAVLSRSGLYRMKVLEESSGKTYLHIFQLEASGQYIGVNDFSIGSEADRYSDLTASFNVSDPENRSIEEAGVIYNALDQVESYKLILGEGGVKTIKGGILENGLVTLTSNDFEAGLFLIRPYVKVGGVYYYGKKAKIFDNNQAQGFATKSINMETGLVNSSAGYSVGNFNGSSVEIMGSGNPVSNLTLDQEGHYWLVFKNNDGIHGIQEMTIDKTAPSLTGITDGQVVNTPVSLVPDDPEARIYIHDGTKFVDFSAGVSLSTPGTYVLRLEDRCHNTKEVYFEYKLPRVTTGESMSVTANSATVSASCANNGSITERGFVYSSSNPLPELGGQGVQKKLPEQDTNPGSMSAGLINLAPASTYYYRAFISYGSAGDSKTLYGDVKTFVTSAVSTPLVMVGHPTGEGVKSRAITMTAMVLDEGGSAVSERGLLVATSENAFASESSSANAAVILDRQGVRKYTASDLGASDFVVKADGLNPETTYFMRAYAVNSSGVSQSFSSVFRTNSEIVVTFDLDGGTRTGGGALVQTGDPGFAVVAPVVSKSGKTLSGWNASLENIQESVTIKALWSDSKAFLVRFDPTGGTRVGGGELEQMVETGFAAVAPIVERLGYVFINWDKLFNVVTTAMDVSANWNEARYDVTFDVNGGVRIGGGPLTQNIKYNDAAIAPIVEKTGSTFSGWSASFDHVTEQMTIKALWDVNRHKVTFNLNGGTINNGASGIQYVLDGANAQMPVVSREGYTFLGWTSDGTNITAPRTIIAHYGRLYSPDKTWKQYTTVSVDITDDLSDPVVQIKFGDDPYVTTNKQGTMNILHNQVIQAKVEYNGEWVQLADLDINFVDMDYPEEPVVTMHPVSGQEAQVKLKVGIGSDALSGVAYNQYRIGETGEWIRYDAPFVMTVPSGTSLRTQTFDQAGNASGSTTYRYAITKKTYNGEDRYLVVRTVPNGEDYQSRQVALNGYYNEQYQQFYDFVTVPSDSYKGCGLTAGKIFMAWYGKYLSQFTVSEYIETTDFGKYLEWLTEDTWADPSIFTTPAQLDNGLQRMLRDYDLNATVSRYSPNSTVEAVKRIETGLLSGNPVVVLVNEGAHWQVISASKIKWRHDGSLEYANFLCHDNGGSRWRTFADMKYFFEDDTDAELARLMGYDSYRDTILTVEIAPKVVVSEDSEDPAPSTQGGGSAASQTPTQITPEATPLSAANNTFFGSSIVADSRLNGNTAEALISTENINNALSGDQNSNLIQIGVNATVSAVTSRLTLPEAGLDAIGNSNRDLAVGTPHAGIRFNAAAVDGIANQANGDLVFSVAKHDSDQLDVEAKRLIGNRPVFEFSITSGGQPITDFGGGTATLTIPYTPKGNEDPDNIIIYYIGSDGTLHTVPGCRYNPATGRVSFNTSHFSLYAVGMMDTRYKDVSDKAWYKDYVQFVSARQLMAASERDLFKPLATLKVSELKAAILSLDPDGKAKKTLAALNQLKPTDALPKQKLADLLSGFASELGTPIKSKLVVLSEPNKKATRAEAAVFLYKLVLGLMNE